MFFSRLPFKVAAAAVILSLVISPAAALAQPADDLLITAQGVGPALLGQSPDDLAEQLGSDYRVGDEVRITVDFDGRVISRNDEVQFRAAMTEPSDLLTLFIVSNPAYRTAEGVGATTTIAEAEAIYGDATLNWNPDDESREFVSFEDGPPGRILFRTPGIGGNNVGIYDDGEFETTEYEDGAAIAAVWVSCVPGQDCPQDLVEPEPTATAEPTAEPTPEPTETPEPEETATPEPEATATPEPTSTPDAGAEGGGGDSGDGGEDLARTGTTELVLISIVALLFVFGGSMVLIERRYLCPSWLTFRR